jgi:hypothetical protein
MWNEGAGNSDKSRKRDSLRQAPMKAMSATLYRATCSRYAAPFLRTTFKVSF